MTTPLPAPWPGEAPVPPPAPVVPPLALSVPRDAPDLVARILTAMAPADPALILLFGDPVAGLPRVGAELRAVLGDCRVVGCSSAGEIGPLGYCNNSVTALGFPAASFRVDVCTLPDQALIPVSGWMSALRGFQAAFRPDLRRASFGVLLADALARQEDVLVATLDAAIPGLPVVGGSSALGISFQPTCQMVDGRALPGTAVFVLIETDLAVAEVSFAHFRPTDRRAVVTAADPQNRIIWELNAEPAAQEYARLAGLPVGLLTPTEFARHPLLLRTGRRHHVRAIRAVTADGGLQLLSGIEAGNILTLGRAVDMTRGFADVMDALPRPPLMVLGFDCILRRLALERAGMTAQMSELLARYRVAGFNTFGEQHSGMHVNQTFVGIALMPPRGDMMFLRDDDAPARRVEKLTRISDVLVDRIDRLEESRGSAWSMFQAAVALEQEVQVRTRELEKALAELSERNRELAVARALAEEANRSKTRFLRAASHDLLQPLSAAKLFLSALADTPLDELQGELASRLSGAFESVEELMHAVLDISRLDSQRIEFQRKPVDLGDMFRRLAVEYAPMAEVKGLKLAFAPTSAVVESDPTFLRRIAQNLVSNAIKYTDHGGVLVGVRKRGERAWLEIMDTGIGIAATDRARIFDEFQRIGREGGAPGMGLGLSIVRRACAKLGHPIAMDSEPGRGTVFRVSLPLIRPGPQPGRTAPALDGPLLRGRVALVIENDHAMRRAYELMLAERLGMVARVTGTIPEALAQMGDDPPDVVIADYNLDNGDTGLQAIRALRGAVGQVVPAIIVSARRDPEIGRASLELGVPVLEKPVRPEDLAAMLQHLLA